MDSPPQAQATAQDLGPAFERAFRLIVSAEGDEYSNHPKDPGGPTGAGGVSWRAVRLRDYDRDGKLDFDLDGDGVVTERDMRLVTLEHARQLFLEDYWRPAKCELFRDAIAIALADSAYNQGPRTAVALLQRALRVGDDGIVGPRTVQAAARADLPDLLARWQAKRLDRYRRDPQADEFFEGWAWRAVRLTAELLRRS